MSEGDFLNFCLTKISETNCRITEENNIYLKIKNIAVTFDGVCTELNDYYCK